MFQVNSQSKAELKENKLEGIWMSRAEKTSNNSEKGFIQTIPGTFKIISSDGKFSNFSIRGYSAIIGTDGLCHVESVQRCVIQSFIDKDNRLVYKLDNNKLFLKFFLEKNAINQNVNIWIEEMWEKVEMPIQATSIIK